MCGNQQEELLTKSLEGNGNEWLNEEGHTENVCKCTAPLGFS